MPISMMMMMKMKMPLPVEPDLKKKATSKRPGKKAMPTKKAPSEPATTLDELTEDANKHKVCAERNYRSLHRRQAKASRQGCGVDTRRPQLTCRRFCPALRTSSSSYKSTRRRTRALITLLCSILCQEELLGVGTGWSRLLRVSTEVQDAGCSKGRRCVVAFSNEEARPRPFYPITSTQPEGPESSPARPSL